MASFNQSKKFLDLVKSIGETRSEVEEDRIILREIENIKHQMLAVMGDLWINGTMDDGVEMGEEIPQTQVKDSEQSRISIIDEIVDDRENMRTEGRSVFPVFYNGDPSAGGTAGLAPAESYAMRDRLLSFGVKKVSLEDNERKVNQLRQEIALLSRLNYENIDRYFGRHEAGCHLHIFPELQTGGSLRSLYRRHQVSEDLGLRDSQKHGLPVSEVSRYTIHILHGLKYLHDKDVIHRDIKGDNILLYENDIVKLADFGLAKVFIGNYGLPADIWSLGCTVLEMLTGKIPYYACNEWPQVLYQHYERNLPDIPKSLPEDARKFIERCLVFDPNDRPTAAELLKDPLVM